MRYFKQTHLLNNLSSYGFYKVLLLTVFICSIFGCQQKFRVPAQSTKYFPKPWAESKEVITVSEQKTKTPKVSATSRPTTTRSSATIPPPTFSGESERVAVLELLNKVPQLVSKDEVSYLTNELRSVASFLPKSKYLVLTKESLEVLIDPSTSLEECVGSCAVETGRLVGAQWILTGEVVRFGKSLRVSLKVHNTQTGQFLKGTSIKGKSVEDLESKLHQQTLILVKEVSPKWGKWLDQVAPNSLEAQLSFLKNKTQSTSSQLP